jgi:predicted ribosome quality control (RQC) complex YloA/Tae2 family protein
LEKVESMASGAPTERSRMGMDVFFLQAVVAELREKAVGGRIKKIHQPDAETVVLRLWTGRRELCLLVSVAPGAARLHLTERPWANPAVPPRFCQLLRARLAMLQSVEQAFAERLVRFVFRGRDGCEYRLVAELFGRRPNLILCDAEGVIIDVLRRSRRGQSGCMLQPGMAYQTPPRPSRQRLDAPQACLPDTWDSVQDVAGQLLRTVEPMSPLIARDMAARIARGAQPSVVLAEFAGRWRREDFAFLIGPGQGAPWLSAFRPMNPELHVEQCFDAPSQAADAYYAAYAGPGRTSGQATLLKVARRALARVDKRLEKLAVEQRTVQAADDLRRRAELLLAALYRVKRGMTELSVEDWEHEGEVVHLALDPGLSPPENVERLFKRYKKAKRAREHVARRIRESRVEKEWLGGLLHALEEARDTAALTAVAREMGEFGLLPGDKSKARRPLPSGPVRLREAHSPGGFVLLWGTNNRANDYLTKHKCRAHDLWFHALGQPGCHLVLRRDRADRPIAEEEVLYAAALAAGFSRAQREEHAQVMVSEGRWVRKPKGALPGLVHVEHYRTVRVAPRRDPWPTVG